MLDLKEEEAVAVPQQIIYHVILLHIKILKTGGAFIFTYLFIHLHRIISISVN